MRKELKKNKDRKKKIGLKWFKKKEIKININLFPLCREMQQII
jgi:hypothetical protein